MTYTRTETAESGGYVSSLVFTAPIFFTDMIQTTIINISFSTEIFGAGTTQAYTPIYTPATTPLAETETLFTYTTSSSASQASSTLLTQNENLHVSYWER
jgi:hypothetical protein